MTDVPRANKDSSATLFIKKDLRETVSLSYPDSLCAHLSCNGNSIGESMSAHIACMTAVRWMFAHLQSSSELRLVGAGGRGAQGQGGSLLLG